MRRSQLLICVIFVVYGFVGIISATGGQNIGSNVLSALSLTALFLSVSDVFGKIANVLFAKNILQNAVSIAVDFLKDKINEGGVSLNINLRNTVENLENTVGYRPNVKLVHPSEFDRSILFRILQIISGLLFIIGVAIFIIMPFIEENLLSASITSTISLFAFAAMMCCMFLDEMAEDINQRNNEIMNEKYAIIVSQYQDFRLYNDLYFHYYKDFQITYGNKMKSKEGK